MSSAEAMDRVERERRFHNRAAREGFRHRRLISRLARTFYDKEIVWASVWHDLGSLRGKLVLDYGCGAGGFSLELSRHGATAIGIDLSEELIFQAQEQARELQRSPSFAVMDAHRLAFLDGSFDLVVGNAILHHLGLAEAYAEVARVLKRGGRAYFMEPLQGHPLIRLARAFTPAARSPDEQPLSLEDLQAAGQVFSKVEHEEFFFVALVAAPLSLLSYRLARGATRLLHRLDRLLMRSFPVCRRWAWITLIRLEAS